jgi:hypothetical protein
MTCRKQEISPYIIDIPGEERGSYNKLRIAAPAL